MRILSTDRPVTTQTRMHRTRRLWLARLRKGLLGFLALILVLATVGFTGEQLLERSEARRYPAPGQLINVDGVKLHLQVTGQPGNGPTVILESGASGFSSQWHHVQTAVAQYTQVVAYDRMGLGGAKTATTHAMQ